MSPRARGYALLVVVYAAALAAAWATVAFTPHEAPLDGPVARGALAYAVATLVVFGFSVATSNSSMYDPYWSVAPPALFAYWAALVEAIPPRALVACALLLIWAVRLTHNFLRGFADARHEDWRYVELRAKHGARYWLVSFVGIHGFPSALTFGGSVSLFVVLEAGATPLGPLDALAALVTLAGIAYEAIADAQLRAFKRSDPPAGAWIRAGLWRHSRHPNYFGETTFWWGLYLFAAAAAPAAWWAAIGPAAITLLFFFVSIPLMDARMSARRPGYADYAKRVSRLVPWPVRDDPR
ncbi:MAG: DUF1295 domain-containing protein [Sandaracinaceae bacterium]|nr:DUF1295 domain-containing protein [Sandaracinaceae bacterium]